MMNGVGKNTHNHANGDKVDMTPEQSPNQTTGKLSVTIPTENVTVSKRARTPESSYQALTKAVSNLNNLDDFEKECLGSGFFSDVFKVTHKVTGQVLVLKMNKSINNRPNMLREVQLMNRLDHPNILKFMGACVDKGVLHALTEFINGGSLEAVLADKTRELSWSMRMRLATDIARGMRYLHSKGFMHRDLTSKNVLIRLNDNDLAAVVGDFGLAAKIPDPLNENGKALPIVGSPYWMAPECIHCQPYNEKADIFSFGIIMCEIIARIEADPDILPRTTNFGLDYRKFSELAIDCPIHFLTLAYNCCQYDPKKRPSFSDICDQLEEVKTRSQMATVLADITNLNIDNEAVVNKTILNKILIGKGLKRHMSDEAITIKVPDIGSCDLWTDDDDKDDTDDTTDDERYVDASSSPPPPASTTTAKIVIPVTAQFVGEVMSQDDPFYTPHKDNPFTSRFKDATSKLVGSLRDNWAAWFEMPIPPSPASPLNAVDDSQLVRPIRVRIRRCHSLPCSPSLARKEIDRFEYERTYDSYAIAKRTFSAMTNLRNMSVTEMADTSFTMAALEVDAVDAQSEDGSSNDSALGIDLKRRKDLHRYRAIKRNLRDLRKLSIDPIMMGTTADRYVMLTRSMESRILDEAMQSGRYSYSSSESFCSLDGSSILSPTSSYSSYSETDTDFWLSRAQFELYEHRLRSRQRFQELVRKWEAKQAAKDGASGAEGGGVAARPGPRPVLLHERLELSDMSDPRFRALRHKWECQELRNASKELSKELQVCKASSRRMLVTKEKRKTTDVTKALVSRENGGATQQQSVTFTSVSAANGKKPKPDALV